MLDHTWLPGHAGVHDYEVATRALSWSAALLWAPLLAAAIALSFWVAAAEGSVAGTVRANDTCCMMLFKRVAGPSAVCCGVHACAPACSRCVQDLWTHWVPLP